MDEDLPLDRPRNFFGDIDKGFEEVDAGDADYRGSQLDLDRAGTDKD